MLTRVVNVAAAGLFAPIAVLSIPVVALNVVKVAAAGVFAPMTVLSIPFVAFNVVNVPAAGVFAPISVPSIAPPVTCMAEPSKASAKYRFPPAPL